MISTGNCFACGRPGHWAADCDKRSCPKCTVRLDKHTQAGLIECAWHGHPCTACGNPPHPDYAAGRCDRYAHPSDTAEARHLRSITPWHRNSDPDTWHTVPGLDSPAPVYTGAPASPPKDPGRHRALAAEQVAEARAARFADITSPAAPHS